MHLLNSTYSTLYTQTARSTKPPKKIHIPLGRDTCAVGMTRYNDDQDTNCVTFLFSFSSLVSGLRKKECRSALWPFYSRQTRGGHAAVFSVESSCRSGGRRFFCVWVGGVLEKGSSVFWEFWFVGREFWAEPMGWDGSRWEVMLMLMSRWSVEWETGKSGWL